MAAALAMPGAHIDAKDLSGRTVLNRLGQDALAVKRLLDLGADCSIPSEEGYVPLHIAAFWGTGNAVIDLLAAGAEIDVRGTNNITPLFLAASAGRSEVVRVLLLSGANWRLKNLNGQTPEQASAATRNDGAECFSMLRAVREQAELIGVANDTSAPPPRPTGARRL